MSKDAPTTREKTRHWIYVLGGEESLHEAQAWQRRKVDQGKRYEVIEARDSAAGQLAAVGHDDVLYIYGDAVITGLEATELAALLRRAGLPAAHRAVKLFLSGSGDEIPGGAPSYAEATYRALQPDFPGVVVYGYRGEVHTEGYDGHKSASLTPWGNTRRGGGSGLETARAARQGQPRGVPARRGPKRRVRPRTPWLHRSSRWEPR